MGRQLHRLGVRLTRTILAYSVEWTACVQNQVSEVMGREYNGFK